MLRGILSNLLLLTVLGAPQISNGAAVILFDENFDALTDGTGITGPQGRDITFDGGDWTITAGDGLSASDDYFRVESGSLEAQDVDSTVTFITDVIAIPVGFTPNSLDYTITGITDKMATFRSKGQETDWTITAGALESDGDRSLAASTDYARFVSTPAALNRNF